MLNGLDAFSCIRSLVPDIQRQSAQFTEERKDRSIQLRSRRAISDFSKMRSTRSSVPRFLIEQAGRARGFATFDFKIAHQRFPRSPDSSR
jgi:hypothetical protein